MRFIKMNSPKATSPAFKNLNYKQRQSQSPVELKEKMRKNYKDKVQNCRNMLLNKFRGPIVETDIRDTLTEIYKSMFNFTDESKLDDEETEVLEEIKHELVQEELEWWVKEDDKSRMANVDWSSMEQDDNVICPICQKTNFSLQNGILYCPHCKMAVRTHKSLMDIKNSILGCVEKHSSMCNKEAQFGLDQELNETHIYLICDSCTEMQWVV